MTMTTEAERRTPFATPPKWFTSCITSIRNGSIVRYPIAIGGRKKLSGKELDPLVDR